jgi:hypothetical protein
MVAREDGLGISSTYVDTEMLDPIAGALAGRQAMIDAIVKLVPISRIATLQDVAKAIPIF